MIEYEIENCFAKKCKKVHRDYGSGTTSSCVLKMIFTDSEKNRGIMFDAFIQGFFPYLFGCK